LYIRKTIPREEGLACVEREPPGEGTGRDRRRRGQRGGDDGRREGRGKE
jgi:hypothetical protein